MQQFHIKLFYILGCDPNIMGIGPVPASRAALKSIGKDLNDMEIVDVRFLVVKKLIFFLCYQKSAAGVLFKHANTFISFHIRKK